MLSFIKEFDKKVKKMKGVTSKMVPPSFWVSIGNYAVNYIVSGSYYRAIPQGRITCLAGPSGSGKSFLLCNLLKSAQEDGCFVLMMDTEFPEELILNDKPDVFKARLKRNREEMLV
jgi:RecA/RadA recombinase